MSMSVEKSETMATLLDRIDGVDYELKLMIPFESTMENNDQLFIFAMT